MLERGPLHDTVWKEGWHKSCPILRCISNPRWGAALVHYGKCWGMSDAVGGKGWKWDGCIVPPGELLCTGIWGSALKLGRAAASFHLRMTAQITVMHWIFFSVYRRASEPFAAPEAHTEHKDVSSVLWPNLGKVQLSRGSICLYACFFNFFLHVLCWEIACLTLTAGWKIWLHGFLAQHADFV